MAATLVYESQRGNYYHPLSWTNPAFQSKHYRNASRLIDAIFAEKAKERKVMFTTERTEVVKENNKVLTIRLRRKN